MKDLRIPTLRRALDALIESLDATLRMKGWVGPEQIPEPLRETAARLLERLGAADRFASMPLRVGPLDEKRVAAMSKAIKNLDAAYVAFRQALERTPDNVDGAIATLREQIDLVKQGNDDWAAR